MAEDKGLYRKKDEQFSYNPKGKNHLFVVGINDYLHFPKLSNAVKDAQDLVEILTTYYHFEKDNIIELFDKEATRRNIFNKFEYLAGRLEKDDNLLIYFSGHGHLNQRTQIGYWIPVEAESVADYVQNSSVKDYLHSIDTHHTFLVADACFSGSLFSGTSKRLETERYITEVDKHKSRWALTSGRLEVVSDGQRGLNSPFASYLLKYLKEEGKPPFAVYDLVQYVKKATANNAEQTPIGGSLQGVGDEGGEFVFYPRENEEIAWQNAAYQNTIQGYQAFLNKYPQSNYAFQAENAIIQLNEELDAQAYQKACKLNTPIGYYDYIDSYPNGKYVAEARTKMREREQAEKEKEAKEALEKAKHTRSLSELMDFKDQYQNFPALIAEANTLITDIKNPKAPDFQTFEKFENPKPIDKELAKAEYTELFQEFYKDAAITPIERKQLQKAQAELGLTELEIKEIEAELSEKTQTTATKEFQTFQKFQTLNIQNTQKQTQPTIFEKNKKAIFSGIAVVFLLVVFFVFKDKIFPNKAETSKKDTPTVTNQDSVYQAIAEQNRIDSINEKRKKDSLAQIAKAKQATTTNNEPLTTNNQKKDLPPLEEPEMVYVQGGTFQMGCDDSRDGNCNDDEKPLHSVKVSDFKIGKYEVTQALWKAVMGKNPSYFKGDNLPVEQVSWNDIQGFLKKLNQLTGKKYRLPTEAEWEYAARGGKKSAGYKYAGSNTLSNVAWNTDNSGGKTHPVGSKSPNELGIYDMSGNVWEWTASGWSDNYESSRISKKFVLRGGSWYYDYDDCRVADRTYVNSSTRYFNDGFRLAQDF